MSKDNLVVEGKEKRGGCCAKCGRMNYTNLKLRLQCIDTECSCHQKEEKCDGCKWNGKEYDLNHGDVIHVNEDGSCAKCGRSRQQAHPLEEVCTCKESEDNFCPTCSKKIGIKPLEEGEFDRLYEILKPKIEDIKSRYPKECNIEGLEPALSTDIIEIVSQTLAQERAKVLAEVREKVEKMLQHYIKGSYYDEAINNVLSLLTDLQVKE